MVNNPENQFRAWQAGNLSDDEWSPSHALNALGRSLHRAAFARLVEERLAAGKP